VWHKKHNYTRPKYLRKFVNDMICKMEITLADGRTIMRDVGVAEFEIKGRTAFGGVVFGEENDDSVLGVTVLETMGWALDLKTGKLRRKRIRF